MLRGINEKIREYYRKIDATYLELPRGHDSRFFKFVWKYPFQRAMHIRDRIQNTSHLRSLAIRFAPQHIYYSLTRWLDPTTVHGRNSSAIPIWSDMVIDIDADRISDAAKTTKELYEYLSREYGYTDMRILFTGNKGFHMYVPYFEYPCYPEDYKERGKMFERTKKEFFDALHAEGFDIDTSLWDLYRVVRVPGTLNASTMTPAYWVSPSDLHKVPQPVKVLPDKPESAYSSTILISSHVIGTPDRHVVFLDYDHSNYRDILDEVLSLQERFKLNDAVVLKTTKGYNVWFFDALPFKRVARIKRNSTEDPVHLEYMRTYGYDVARIGPRYVQLSGEISHDPAPSFYEMLRPRTRTSREVSLGHWELARELYFVDLGSPTDYGLIPIGSGTVKIIFASRKIPKKQ